MSPSAPRVHALDALAARVIGNPPVREVVPRLPISSVNWSTHGYPDPLARWNFHPEYEIHLIRRTTGRYIIGSEVGSFGPGHLAIVGPYVPHDWISDLPLGETVEDRDVVLHFHEDWVFQCAQVLPELHDLESFLARAARGIEFSGESAAKAADELLLIGETSGVQRLRHVFSLFALLSSAPTEDRRFLMGGWVPKVHSPDALEVVNRAIDYIFANIAGAVRLDTAAELAGMSPSAFSRFFKSASGHTFSDMITQLRLAEARRLLRTTCLSIASIAQRVGYTNLSNFNRQFRTHHGMPPREYRKGQRQL